jgi:prolyl-tRNA synthetase
VVVAQQDDAAVAGMGEQEYRRLLDAGVDTIIDDRPVRAGAKFSDAELVGIPFRVTIGKRGLAAGNAEVSDRATGEAAAVALDEIAGHVRKTVAHAIAGQP